MSSTSATQVQVQDTGARIFNWVWPRAAFLVALYIGFRLFVPAKTQAKVDFFLASVNDIMDEYNSQYDHDFDDSGSEDEEDETGDTCKKRE